MIFTQGGVPMYCTQCGSKIEDGYRFCPVCGDKTVDDSQNRESEQKNKLKRYSYYPCGKMNKKLSQLEVERIADDIFNKNHKSNLSNISAWQLAAGIDAITAKGMLDKRLRDCRLNEREVCCPKCGSDHVQYKPGSTWAYSGTSVTMIDAPRVYLRCVDCGKQWSMKSNQWKNL